MLVTLAALKGFPHVCLLRIFKITSQGRAFVLTWVHVAPGRYFFILMLMAPRMQGPRYVFFKTDQTWDYPISGHLVGGGDCRGMTWPHNPGQWALSSEWRHSLRSQLLKISQYMVKLLWRWMSFVPLPYVLGGWLSLTWKPHSSAQCYPNVLPSLDKNCVYYLETLMHSGHKEIWMTQDLYILANVNLNNICTQLTHVI